MTANDWVTLAEWAVGGSIALIVIPFNSWIVKSIYSLRQQDELMKVQLDACRSEIRTLERIEIFLHRESTKH